MRLFSSHPSYQSSTAALPAWPAYPQAAGASTAGTPTAGIQNAVPPRAKARPASARLLSILLFILLLGGLLLLPLSQAETAYGNLVEQSDSFYVADEADVISADTETYICGQNAILEGVCGGQIVVVTVDFLDGMDIEDYAYKLFADWEIGDADKNNGVLLLLAVGEEDYWCMPGKGLENKLSSGDIDEILWNYLEPDFAAGNYDNGVRSTFDALYDAVCAAYGLSGDTQQSGYGEDAAYDSSTAARHTFFHYFVIGILVLVAFVVILGILAAVRTGRGMFTSGPVARSYRRRHVFIPRPARPPRPPGGSASPKPPRPTSSRPKSTRSFRPSSGSFGGGHRSPMGRGGGGHSRGGGAGRRH